VTRGSSRNLFLPPVERTSDLSNLVFRHVQLAGDGLDGRFTARERLVRRYTSAGFADVLVVVRFEPAVERLGADLAPG